MSRDSTGFEFDFKGYHCCVVGHVGLYANLWQVNVGDEQAGKFSTWTLEGIERQQAPEMGHDSRMEYGMELGQ